MNVIPHVIRKPTNGGSSIGTAQFDFGGVMPSVRLPSLTDGSNDLKTLSTVSGPPAGMTPS